MRSKSIEMIWIAKVELREVGRCRALEEGVTLLGEARNRLGETPRASGRRVARQ